MKSENKRRKKNEAAKTSRKAMEKWLLAAAKHQK